MKASWPARHAACLALLALLFPTVTAAETRPDRVIATSSGAVAAADGEILAFKGMPYAAPPIGPLRDRRVQVDVMNSAAAAAALGRRTRRDPLPRRLRAGALRNPHRTGGE